MEDTRNMLYIHNHNPTLLHEIAQASQINNAAAFSPGNNHQINEASRCERTHLFEDKLTQMLDQYRSAGSVVQGTIINVINDGIELIRREKRQHEEVQDPPEIQGNRTYGRGGPRKRTGAELAVARLKKGDRPTGTEIHSTPAISMVNSNQTETVDSEVEIVRIGTVEERQAEAEEVTATRNRCSKPRHKRIPPPETEISPQTSPSRPKRSAGLPYRYRQGKGMLVQPGRSREYGN